MEFNDAIYFILKGIKRTLQIELDNWFGFLDSGKTMTKQVLYKTETRGTVLLVDIALFMVVN